MENQRIIYKVLSCICLILICMLIFLIKPANIYYNAIDFALVIALLIVEIKIYLQLRKLKSKKKRE